MPNGEDYESPPPEEEPLEEQDWMTWGPTTEEIVAGLSGEIYESPQGGGTMPMLQRILMEHYGIGTPEWWEEVGDEYTWDDILMMFDPYDLSLEEDELSEYLTQLDTADVSAQSELFQLHNALREYKSSSGFARQGTGAFGSAYEKQIEAYNLERSRYKDLYEKDISGLQDAAATDFYGTITELAGMDFPMGGEYGGDYSGGSGTDDYSGPLPGGPFGTEEDYILGYKGWAESNLPPWLHGQILGGYNWELGEDDPSVDPINYEEVFNPQDEIGWDESFDPDPWGDPEEWGYGS